MGGEQASYPASHTGLGPSETRETGETRRAKAPCTPSRLLEYLLGRGKGLGDRLADGRRKP